MTTTDTIWLDITGAYGTHADAPAEGTDVFEAIGQSPKGHEDADGVEHFNDRVMTPLGLLGKLKTHVDVGDDGEPVLVIDQADAVVLVSNKPLEEWSWDKQVGVTIDLNPFGFRMFTLNARNGMVRYMLHDNEVRWTDRPDEDTGLQVAKLMQSQWVSEGALPARLTHKTDIQVVRKPS